MNSITHSDNNIGNKEERKTFINEVKGMEKKIMFINGIPTRLLATIHIQRLHQQNEQQLYFSPEHHTTSKTANMKQINI